MTAKMAATLDTISGGRLVLGLGAGFKDNEARAFGHPYPELKERLAILSEHFEIVSRMTRRDEAAVHVRGPPCAGRGRHERAADRRWRPRPAAHRRARPERDLPSRRDATAMRSTSMPRSTRWPTRSRRSAAGATRSAAIPPTLTLATGTNPAWPYPGLRTIGKQRMMTQEDLPAIMVVRLQHAPAARRGAAPLGRAGARPGRLRGARPGRHRRGAVRADRGLPGGRRGVVRPSRAPEADALVSGLGCWHQPGGLLTAGERRDRLRGAVEVGLGVVDVDREPHGGAADRCLDAGRRAAPRGPPRRRRAGRTRENRRTRARPGGRPVPRPCRGRPRRRRSPATRRAGASIRWRRSRGTSRATRRTGARRVPGSTGRRSSGRTAGPPRASWRSVARARPSGRAGRRGSRSRAATAGACSPSTTM